MVSYGCVKGNTKEICWWTGCGYKKRGESSVTRRFWHEDQRDGVAIPLMKETVGEVGLGGTIAVTLGAYGV